jgi:membrane protease YdiL (CAAX protease family)
MAALGAAVFIAVVGTYLALGVEGIRDRARQALARLPDAARPFAMPALLLALVLCYSAAAALPVSVRAIVYAAYLVLPAALMLGAGRFPMRAPLWELAAAGVLWLPIELHRLPPLPAPIMGGQDLSRLVGLVAAVWLFVVARPLDGVGLTYRLGRRDVGTALVVFAIYAAIALPIGFATGFIGWHPEVAPFRVVVNPLLIYVLIALPEEFLFRGLFQNLFRQWLGSAPALVIASIIFGLAHLPDRRYVALAAIAGVAYGTVYARTRKITAAALTHALVDAVWDILLGG